MKTVGVKTIPDPAGAITGRDTVCQGVGNLIYSVPPIAGATGYIWSLPAGITITAGTGTNQVTLQYGAAAQSGNIMVKGNNDCGPGIESAKPVAVKNCDGIEQKSLESAVRIYPNPVNGVLTIIIEGKENQLDMTISDISGKIQYSEKLSGISAAYRKSLDMSGFAKGVYFLKLYKNDRVYVEKVMVQ